jgi:putative flippase GtrA
MPANSALKRWVVFNSVGAMGILVQMGILLLLTYGFAINYLLATGLGVESAVLHNFAWHQHWTWADRPLNSKRMVLGRIVSFHLTNGALSLAGNLILTRLLVEMLQWNHILANAVAILVCSIFNYFSGDRIVFRCTNNQEERT